MAEKVVIYTRVSTEEQARAGTSLAGQRATCLEYCERQGYKGRQSFCGRRRIGQDGEPNGTEGDAGVLPH